MGLRKGCVLRGKGVGLSVSCILLQKTSKALMHGEGACAGEGMNERPRDRSLSSAGLRE